MAKKECGAIINRSLWQAVTQAYKSPRKDIQGRQAQITVCADQTRMAATLVDSTVLAHIELATVLGWALKKTCKLRNEPEGDDQVRLLRVFADRMDCLAMIGEVERSEVLRFIQLTSSQCPTSFLRSRIESERKRTGGEALAEAA